MQKQDGTYGVVGGSKDKKNERIMGKEGKKIT